MRCKNAATEAQTHDTHSHTHTHCPPFRFGFETVQTKKFNNFFFLRSRLEYFDSLKSWDGLWNAWLSVILYDENCCVLCLLGKERERGKKLKIQKFPIAKNIIFSSPTFSQERNEENKNRKKKYMKETYYISVAHADWMLQLKLNSKSLQSSFPKTTPSRRRQRTVRKINK